MALYLRFGEPERSSTFGRARREIAVRANSKPPGPPGIAILLNEPLARADFERRGGVVCFQYAVAKRLELTRDALLRLVILDQKHAPAAALDCRQGDQSGPHRNLFARRGR